MEQYYSPTGYRLEDSGPRAPPRFMRPPIRPSLGQEKPRPLVPDVSLIFSPSQAVKYSSPRNNNNSRDSGMTMSPFSPQPETISTKLLQELIDMVKRQSTTIERMDHQLQTLVAAQAKERESSSRKLEKMDQQLQTLVAAQAKERESSTRKIVDQEVQTEPDTETTDSRPPTNNGNVRERRDTRRNSNQGSDSSSPSSSASSRRRSNSPPHSSTKYSGGPCCNGNGHTKKEQMPSAKANEKKGHVLLQSKPNTSTSIDESMTEPDYSRALLEIQLSTIAEQSKYSEDNSIRYDFDGIDNSQTGSPGFETSVSLYSTSTEDEDEDTENIVKSKPAERFIKNAIGTVDRLLESDDSPPPAPRHRQKTRKTHTQRHPHPTDTTMYGMTSNNLSFATRQYLQRHGLVNPKYDHDQDRNPEPRQAQRFLPNPALPYPPQPHYPTTDRILDLTTLRNQPKLL